jgi:hypothetical protein
MNIIGMGGGWANYVEVEPEKMEMMKLQLYPDDLRDD